MSYLSISQAATDPRLRDRITACAVQEGGSPGDLGDLQWKCACEPGWGEAWESALAAGNPDPGGDPAVIGDGMILTAVQKWIPGGTA